MINIVKDIFTEFPHLEDFIKSNNEISQMTYRSLLGINKFSHYEIGYIMSYLSIACRQETKIDEALSVHREYIQLLGSRYKKGKYKNLQKYLNYTHLLYDIPLNINNSNIIEQVNKYEELYGWKHTDKFLFPNNKFGNYSLLVIEKLMKSKNLIKFKKNEFDRYKWIIENQIYIQDLSPLNNFGYSCIIDIGNQFKKNIYFGDFLNTELDKHFKVKFKAIFCEPPKKYFNSNKYIYSDYVIEGMKYNSIINMLIYSRWMQTNSSRLKYLINLRNKITNSNKLKYLKTYQITTDKDNINNGGLCFIIYDPKYKGNVIINDIEVDVSKYDIIPKDGKYIPLIERIVYDKSFVPLNSLSIRGCGWSGINTNIALDEVQSKNTYRVVTKNGFKWIKKYYVSNELYGLDTWKVFFPESSTMSGKGFGKNIKIGEPYDICNQTFSVFFVNSEKKAKSLISYIKTKFANKMVSLRKIKNHVSIDTLDWVPRVPLDREWTDKKLEKYFNLTEEEINLINN